MQTLEPLPFLSGMSIAFCLTIFLICGLQLCFRIFNRQSGPATMLSRWCGIILLCYVVVMALDSASLIVPGWEKVIYFSTAVDILLISLLGCCAYIIYAGRHPSPKVMVATMSPYFAILVLTKLVPHFSIFAYDSAMLTVTAQYLYYAKALRLHEKQLDNIYANRDAHSVKWLRVAAALFLCYWFGHFFCMHSDAMEYYTIVVFISGAVFTLYTTVKISAYAEPVSTDTLQQVEHTADDQQDLISPQKSQSIQQALIQLYEQRQVYLNPDLTVVDVAQQLNTNTKYISVALNRGMNTSFYEFTNNYRIRRAKELLQDPNIKIAFVARQSGFNSPQVLNRAFIRSTGKTPSEWRETR